MTYSIQIVDMKKSQHYDIQYSQDKHIIYIHTYIVYICIYSIERSKVGPIAAKCNQQSPSSLLQNRHQPHLRPRRQYHPRSIKLVLTCPLTIPTSQATHLLQEHRHHSMICIQTLSEQVNSQGYSLKFLINQMSQPVRNLRTNSHRLSSRSLTLKHSIKDVF